MARLAAQASSSRANTVDSAYRTPSVQPPTHGDSPSQASPGNSSDKENRQPRLAAIKAGKMPAPADQSARGPKRRRLGDLDGSVQYESSSSESDNEGSIIVGEDAQNDARNGASTGPRYDPHQSMDERRELRKNYRELDKEMQDSRAELIAPASRGLQDMVAKQNLLFGNVKQTSDATIDSRMLVNAGDLTHKRTKKLNVSENAQGIDLEEFVGKCISYMGHDGVDNEEDENGENQGNALDWNFLGTNACFPSNIRPPTIGFLLGPLAVQKRVRQPTQKRARAKNANANVEAVKAKELKASDLQSQENTGLVSICNNVQAQFMDAFEDGHNLVQQFWDRKESGETTPEEEAEFEKSIWIMDDGGINFFKFAIHPTDFGQTAENLFYISFLIRDDHLRLELSPDTGLPSLHPIEEKVRKDTTRVKETRNQAVFALDFETWEGLVKEFYVDKSMIPDRSSFYEATQQPNANGWYG